MPASKITAVSRQTGAPVAQDITPCLHGVGLVLHATPSTHTTQLPEESQTWLELPVPHGLPASTLEAESVQVGLPELQLTTPTLQALALPLQVPPASQAPHPPSVQASAPQPPSGRHTPGEHWLLLVH